MAESPYPEDNEKLIKLIYAELKQHGQLELLRQKAEAYGVQIEE